MLASARARPPPKCPALTLLPRCKSLPEAQQIHARLITTGSVRNPSVSAQLVLGLCSSPHHELRLLARRIFFSLPNRKPSSGDPFLWNALIKASSNGNDLAEAILTFALMLSDGVSADKFSFSLALKACARISSVREGVQIHSLMIKTKMEPDLYLDNSLVGFYSKCRLPDNARVVFDRITHRDSVSWNSMIDGYARSGKMGAAQEVFDEMKDSLKNLITWNSMINGYAHVSNAIDVAKNIFYQAPERDSVSWNLLIHGYVKSGRLFDAMELFEEMPEKDVVAWANVIAGYMDSGIVDHAMKLFKEMSYRDVITWNIIIDGHVKNGKFDEAICLFQEMRIEGNVSPDVTTLASVLSAIAELGHISDGIHMHEYIKRNCFSLDGKLGVALIDMYSKCGYLEKALDVFEVSQRSADHWNAMIGGLAIHGYGKSALKLFEEMQTAFCKPDDITFIGVLNACSHAGLVEEGLKFFERMTKDSKLKPKIQHYGCMVDILSRAGKLEEAWRFIESMPIEPNLVMFQSLLSACRNHGNIEIGQKVLQKLVEGGQCDFSSYVLLSKTYARCGFWEQVSTIRAMLKDNDIVKIPGCSWIEVDGSVHEFVVGDVIHSKSKDMVLVL